MIGILFPGAESYRPGIGRELHENFDVLAPLAAAYERLTGSTLADDVWYGPASAAEPPAPARAAAVLAVACGFHAVFVETFELPSAPVLIGEGTGLLAALVRADALDVDHACAILDGAEPQESWFRSTDPGTGVAALDDGVLLREPADMLRAVRAIDATDGRSGSATERAVAALGALDIDIAVEIGPGDELAAWLRPHLADDVIVGALDSTVNAQTFLDTVAVRKFFNVRFVAERALGQIVGTRNRVGGAESEEAVLEIARRLRRMLAEEPLPTEPEAALSGDWADTLATILAYWVENARRKGQPEAELDASLRALETTTLLPIRTIAGADATGVAAHREGSSIHAF